MCSAHANAMTFYWRHLSVAMTDNLSCLPERSESYLAQESTVLGSPEMINHSDWDHWGRGAGTLNVGSTFQ